MERFLDGDGTYSNVWTMIESENHGPQKTILEKYHQQYKKAFIAKGNIKKLTLERTSANKLNIIMGRALRENAGTCIREANKMLSVLKEAVNTGTICKKIGMEYT